MEESSTQFIFILLKASRIFVLLQFSDYPNPAFILQDNLFVSFNLDHGYHMDPKRLKDWWVIGKNNGKRVAGRIKDIYMSRDLLVKQKNGDVSIIPFEDVVYLRKNSP